MDNSADVGLYSSLALSSTDKIYIAYYDNTNYDLRLATNKNGFWSTSSPDSFGIVGSYTSIALDSNDDVHISYHDTTNDVLKHITDKSGSWVTTSVDSSGGAGYGTSIAIDSNDDVHISYRQNTLQDLKYATDKSGSWVITTIDASGNVGAFPSIAIDSNDDVHISYLHFGYHDLKYATDKSGSWVTTSPDTDGVVGYYPSIAIDSNDAVHISYHANSQGLKYVGLDSSSNILGYSISPDLPAGLDINLNTGEISGTPTELSTNTTYTITVRNSGGANTTTITIEVLDQLPTLSYSPSTVVLTKGNQSSDLPLSATLTGSGTITSWAISPAVPSGLSFGTSNGTIWGIATVLQTNPVTYTVWANNSGGSVNATVNITVNDETPDISYSPDWFVLTNNTAMSPTATPTNSGGAIPSGIIDSSAYVGQESSIAVDSNGYTHIAHYDATNADLKYTTDKNGTWVSTTVDVTGVVGKYPSIALDSNGKVHISYFDQTNNDLKFATDSSGAWVISSIATSNDVGKYSSIAIDSNDKVHISYYDDSFDYLKYATNKTGAWVVSTVDSIGNAGTYTSIGIDSNGHIHISYGSTGGLKYATDKTGSWAYSVIDSTSNSGYHTSIAVDSNDKIHISHYDLNQKDLRYSTDKSGSWVHTIIDSSGSVGFYTSLEVDSNQKLHISYYDFTDDSLLYATDKTGSWVISVLDENGQDGSIAVDSTGRVHVSYYDDTVNNLAYVTLDSASNILGYSISPSLPAGLNLNIGTGEITGTLTALSTNTTYTVTVRNSGGTDTTTFTIVVNDVIPTLSYLPENLTLTKDQSSSDLPLTATLTGSGVITSWEINGSLPLGLNFGTSNGTIWGIPTVLELTAVTYTIWANNSGGSTSATINITINDEVPTLSYSYNDIVGTINVGINPHSSPTTAGGTITSWGISPSPGSAFHFNLFNGVISGTPGILLTRTQYTIYANNSGGSALAYVNVTINDNVPILSYSPENLTLSNNTVSSDLPLAPTLTGSGTITLWEINGSLPTGLNFGTSNGTIWGIPEVLELTAVTYTIWANNSGGSSSASINITINDNIPILSYSPENLTLYNNTISSVLPLAPTLTGSGTITLWEINGSLPLGLNFGTSNGTIWGIPTVLELTAVTYTIWANNSGGSSSASINITVLHEAPIFTYSSYDLILENNTDMTAIEATVIGGDITSWDIESSIPLGLVLGTTNGTIFGTPTVVQSMTMYQIWGNNSGGSHSVFINITIYDPVVDLEYNPENATLTRGVLMTPLNPTHNGIVDSWEVEGNLPNGVLFNEGLFYGTPLVNMTRTTYTVWANNSGGSASHTVNLTVLEPIVTLDYNPENFTLVRSIPMTTLHPTVTGGNVETWGIHPSIPAGLNFANGVLSGTPTVNLTRTTFTIYANTTGGSTTHTVNFTILEPGVILEYNPENQTLIRGVPMVTMTPTVTNGTAESWSIDPELPDGLAFSNGIISGTPTGNMSRQIFTVWANTTGGAHSIPSI